MEAGFVTSLENPEYFGAFMLGFAFIAMFARDRLFVRIDEKSEQRNRMIDLLEPSKLVRRKMFWRGLIIYFMLLSVIYALLCGLSHPLFPVLKHLWPDFWELIGYNEVQSASSPVVPLVISMAVMGLLPQLPWIKRLEEIARRITLRLVSIPDSFNDLTDALFYTEFDASKLPKRSRKLIALVEERLTALPKVTASPSIMRKSLVKHQFFIALLGRHEIWPERDVQGQFRSIWADINERALALEVDLRDLTNRSALYDQVSQDEKEALTASWNVMATRLRRTTEDICALIAIYSENSRSLPRRRHGINEQVEPDQRVHDDGLEELRRAILHARGASDQSQKQFTLALISTLAACFALFFVGFLGSYTGFFTEFSASEMLPPMEPGDDPHQRRILLALAAGSVWLFGAALTYLPAALVAWGVRLRLDARGEWSDVYHSGHLTQLQKVGFYWRVFLPAYLTSALCLLSLMVIVAATRSEDPSVLSNWRLSWGDVSIPMLYGLLGAIYSVALIRIFDFSETAYAENQIIKLGDIWHLTCWSLAALLFATALGCFAQTFASPVFSDPAAKIAFNKELIFKLFSAVVFGVLSIYLILLNLNDLRKAEARRRKMRSTEAYGDVQEAQL